MHVFFELDGVPTNSCILFPSRDEALACPRGDIALGFCGRCGFVSNVGFDPTLTEYSGRYEETQGFSETFNAFHRALAQRLIERHDLRGKDVLEIGCGKGEFLALLSDLGDNRGVGFDPGYREERMASVAGGRLTFVTDFYSEQYAHHRADFVCCKMTLEHIHATGQFVRMVRDAIGERHRTIVFFQVPDVTRILRDCAFEDIYYEHCSYFSPGSLARLFRRSGFDVLNVDTEYAGQYVTLEARASPPTAEPVSDADELELMTRWVAEFPGRSAAKVEGWRRLVRQAIAEGRRVVAWGSGSKGVAFLTALGGDEAGIEYVVDVNPYRHGHFMPGTGQPIVSPASLHDYRPDLVIVMNPIYRDEIALDLARRGLEPRILTL